MKAKRPRIIALILTLAAALFLGAGCENSAEDDPAPVYYTVTFDSNGGTGSMAVQQFTVGEAQSLHTNAFTRTGYSFTGWNTKDDGSGRDYADKATVKDLATIDGATVTLYAQWEEQSDIGAIDGSDDKDNGSMDDSSENIGDDNTDDDNVKILYEIVSDTPVDNIKVYIFKYENLDTLPYTSGFSIAGLPTAYTDNDLNKVPKEVNKGYFFDGWYTTPNCTDRRVTELHGTLYAKWIQGCVAYSSPYLWNELFDNELFFGDTYMIRLLGEWEWTSYGLADIASFIRLNSSENRVILDMSHATVIAESWNMRKCVALTRVILPDSLTSIPYQAFANCSLLEDITIPDSVTNIEEEAFIGCSNLTVTVGTSIEKDNYGDIFDFDGCKAIIIKDSVTSIGACAFWECSSIKSITIPDSVTDIGEDAFSYCYSLKNVTLSKNIAAINYSTFSGCTLLEDIVIPDSVTDIGKRAFSYCRSLKNVTIGKSVTYIDDEAFYYCDSITTVLYVDSLEKWLNIYFFDLYANPCWSGAELYISGKLPENIVIPDSITSIGGYAFVRCASLKSVIIPNSVTSIDQMAFYSCTSLNSVTIGSNVERIASAVFMDCTQLSTIIFSGTTKQWNDMYRDRGSPFTYPWAYNVPATTIICNNGNVDMDEWQLPTDTP